MVVLLDGGFSTQVMKYVDISKLSESPLWCAEFLSSNPDAVIKAHSDYVKVGCDVISTNTYQASVDGFQQHLNLDCDSSIALIKKAVDLARKAVSLSANGRKVLVAGSVGAYGACLHDGSEYRGEYVEQVTAQQLKDWHRPRIAALVEAGVDLLAVETIPAAFEAVAVLQLLRDEFPTTKAWVTFTCKDESRISHGELFSEAVSQCCEVSTGQLLAVGVNCLHPKLVAPLLSSAQDHKVPFVVYPNSGEMWQPDDGWKGIEYCLPLTHHLPDWLSLGAEYIGGCCRTSADDIKLCRDYLDSQKP